MADPRNLALRDAEKIAREHSADVFCIPCDEPAPCQAFEHAQRAVEQLVARVSAAAAE